MSEAVSHTAESKGPQMTPMTQNSSQRRIAAIVLGLLLAVATAAVAQSTMIKGKVVDAKGQPVAGVVITIEFMGGVTRKLSTKTDKRGEFIQLLTQSGQYKVTAADDKVGAAEAVVGVRLGSVAEANIVLAPTTAANNDAKAAELRNAFDAGVTASRAGNHDAAIEKFQAALSVSPACFDCLYNIGVAYLAKKDEKQAEESWKKALAVKADYTEALNALSTLYNNQKRFDEASAMSAKAASAGGGGSADATFNQGIILWNQGKIADAKAKFEETIKLNPAHGDAHYQLGMALLNEGKLPDAVAAFETYVKLEPNGQYATQAKGMIAQLKK